MEESIMKGNFKKDSGIEKNIMDENMLLNKFLDMSSYFDKQFQLEEVDMKTYSPLTLAYIGDGIYDLIIRTIVVRQGNVQVNKLHRRTSELVNAGTQSAMVETILPYLTNDEVAIYKRGRNAKSATVAKNATVSDYRRATGFEALIGYLYLNKDMKRMIELVKIGLDGSKL